MNEVTQILLAISGAFIGGTAVIVSLFLWVRSEANSDRRYFQQIQSEDRKDILNLIRAMEHEIKDFHYKITSERGVSKK